jgi:glycosyltransferase involved in cell wall biosynthesis
MSSNPLFTCVTNIPNPYRLYEFECLKRDFDKRGIDFEAIFMAQTEPGRLWSFHPEEWSFHNYVARGVHPHWKILAFHFNPGVIFHLLRHPPRWLLLGGGWSVPTTSFLAFLVNLMLPGTTLLFWTEATLSYSKYARAGWRHKVKQIALSPYSAFVVPGVNSIDYLQEALNNKAVHAIRLSNFVDEQDYHVKVKELRLQCNKLRAKYELSDEVVFLLPARLIPEKGIMPFLAAIRNLPESNCRVLLAGDGPLSNEIANYLQQHNMNFVRLLGHQDLSHLLELYALSDAMVLPSPREPYGFVAVEALWAGLPLILSREIGAVPEVLEEGKNGWCFAPFTPSEVISAMSNAVAVGREGLAKMGARSLQIAHEQFAAVPAAQRFVDDLLRAFPFE